MNDLNDTPSIEVTIDDLRNNGVEISETPMKIIETSFQPGEFEKQQADKETTSIPEYAVPGFILQIREGLFRAFSLIPCVSDRERVFNVTEGAGETADSARSDCLRKTSSKMQGEAEAAFDYIGHRQATDAASGSKS
jgi:hypothetical protein